MKILLNSRTAIGLIAVVASALAAVAYATSPFDITFPVREAGLNCENKEDCRTKCDLPEYQLACEAFAKKHGLGGGDNNQEKKGVAEFLRAIEKDGGPDGVCGKAENPIKACEATCNVSANMERCIAYALQHNLTQGKEKAEMEKILAALRRGITPPCSNENDCREKCEEFKTGDVNQLEQCMRFAVEADLLPEEVNKDQALKMVALMKSGKLRFRNPRDFEKCDSDPALVDDCIAAGIELGFMKPEEAEFARKMMTEGGPGGCKGKMCKTYCEEHQDECMEYFESKGMVPEEAKQEMRRGLERMREAFAKAPPDVLQCVRETLDPQAMRIVESESADAKPSELRRVGEQIGTAMRECFARLSGNGHTAPSPGESGERPFPENETVRACFKEIGFDPSAAEGPPPPDMEARLRECVSRMSGVLQRPAPPPGYQSETSAPQSIFPAPPPEENVAGTREYQEEYERRYEEIYNQQYLEEFRAICIAQGGVWSGTSCERPPAPSQNFQDECMAHGGTWNGTACEFPPQSQRINPPGFFQFLGTVAENLIGVRIVK